ncbi:hypothetical protein [Roseibium sp.]|uniref:hypothetical protein n=1 Tax=Roseibium sp. TaxID=1936156 RepID=UPI003D0E446B
MTPEIAISGPRRIPLGVGVLLGESFSILFRHFFAVLLLGFLPSLLGHYLVDLLAEFAAANDLFGQSSYFNRKLLTLGLKMIAGLAVYALTTALLIQLVYDVKLRRPVRLRRYPGPALRATVPIVLSCIVVIALLAAIVYPIEIFDFSGTILLMIVLPTTLLIVLLVCTAFSLTPPAIVIERAGFRGLGRSIFLTRNYRLPIAGALFLMSIIYFFISTAQTLAIILGGFVESGEFALLMMVALPATIATVLLAILTSLIYARLRELKEGVSVDHLANVFE